MDQGGFQPVAPAQADYQATVGGGFQPPAQGGFQPPPQGGFQPQQQQGGSQPQQQGGFQPQQQPQQQWNPNAGGQASPQASPQGGFQPQQGGFQPQQQLSPQAQGGFQPPQQQGFQPQQQQSGGFQPPQQQGGFQPPQQQQGGFQPPQQGGFQPQQQQGGFQPPQQQQPQQAGFQPPAQQQGFQPPPQQAGAPAPYFAPAAAAPQQFQYQPAVAAPMMAQPMFVAPQAQPVAIPLKPAVVVAKVVGPDGKEIQEEPPKPRDGWLEKRERVNGHERLYYRNGGIKTFVRPSAFGRDPNRRASRVLGPVMQIAPLSAGDVMLTEEDMRLKTEYDDWPDLPLVSTWSTNRVCEWIFMVRGGYLKEYANMLYNQKVIGDELLTLARDVNHLSRTLNIELRMAQRVQKELKILLYKCEFKKRLMYEANEEKKSNERKYRIARFFEGFEKSKTDPIVKINQNDIEPYDRLGQGAEGTVYAIKWDKGRFYGVQFVAKYMTTHKAEDGEPADNKHEQDIARRRCVQEMNFMWQLRLPSVVTVYGVWLEPPMIIMERAYDSVWETFVVAGKHKGDWQKQATIMWNVATALEYMHQAGILHRDIAGRNVLLTGQLLGKLSDFGLAIQEKDLEEYYRVTRGLSQNDPDVHPDEFKMVEHVMSLTPHPEWLAPETCSNRAVWSRATDIFSFGRLMFEIMTGQKPFPKIQTSEGPKLRELVAQGASCGKLPDNCPPALQNLMESCTTMNPAERPTAAEVVVRLHNYIKGLLPPEEDMAADEMFSQNVASIGAGRGPQYDKGIASAFGGGGQQYDNGVASAFGGASQANVPYDNGVAAYAGRPAPADAGQAGANADAASAFRQQLAARGRPSNPPPPPGQASAGTADANPDAAAAFRQQLAERSRLSNPPPPPAAGASTEPPKVVVPPPTIAESPAETSGPASPVSEQKAKPAVDRAVTSLDGRAKSPQRALSPPPLNRGLTHSQSTFMDSHQDVATGAKFTGFLLYNKKILLRVKGPTSRWVRRFCVLKDMHFSMYKKAKDARPKSSFTITAAGVVQNEDGHSGKAEVDSLVRADGTGSKFFSITLGNDTILLAADSTEDRLRWVAALKSEITGTPFEVTGTEGLSQSGKRLVTSLHEGYLTKSGKWAVVSRDKSRYFVLSPNKLVYFKHKAAATRTGAIILYKGVDVAAISEDPLNFIVTTGDRVYRLWAETEEERNEWVLKIKQVLDHFSQKENALTREEVNFQRSMNMLAQYNQNLPALPREDRYAKVLYAGEKLSQPKYVIAVLRHSRAQGLVEVQMRAVMSCAWLISLDTTQINSQGVEWLLREVLTLAQSELNNSDTTLLHMCFCALGLMRPQQVYISAAQAENMEVFQVFLQLFSLTIAATQKPNPSLVEDALRALARINDNLIMLVDYERREAAVKQLNLGAWLCSLINVNTDLDSMAHVFHLCALWAPWLPGRSDLITQILAEMGRATEHPVAMAQGCGAVAELVKADAKTSQPPNATFCSNLLFQQMCVSNRMLSLTKFDPHSELPEKTFDLVLQLLLVGRGETTQVFRSCDGISCLVAVLEVDTSLRLFLNAVKLVQLIPEFTRQESETFAAIISMRINTLANSVQAVTEGMVCMRYLMTKAFATVDPKTNKNFSDDFTRSVIEAKFMKHALEACQHHPMLAQVQLEVFQTLCPLTKTFEPARQAVTAFSGYFTIVRVLIYHNGEDVLGWGLTLLAHLTLDPLGQVRKVLVRDGIIANVKKWVVAVHQTSASILIKSLQLFKCLALTPFERWQMVQKGVIEVVIGICCLAANETNGEILETAFDFLALICDNCRTTGEFMRGINHYVRKCDPGQDQPRVVVVVLTAMKVNLGKANVAHTGLELLAQLTVDPESALGVKKSQAQVSMMEILNAVLRIIDPDYVQKYGDYQSETKAGTYGGTTKTDNAYGSHYVSGDAFIHRVVNEEDTVGMTIRALKVNVLDAKTGDARVHGSGLRLLLNLDTYLPSAAQNEVLDTFTVNGGIEALSAGLQMYQDNLDVVTGSLRYIRRLMLGQKLENRGVAATQNLIDSVSQGTKLLKSVHGKYKNAWTKADKEFKEAVKENLNNEDLWQKAITLQIAAREWGEVRMATEAAEGPELTKELKKVLKAQVKKEAGTKKK